MTQALYLQLFHEFDEGRYESRVAAAALTRLGAPALAFRGFARARRRTHASARADFEAALAHPRGVTPLLVWVCGAGLFCTHAYDRALTVLARAATLAPAPDPIGVSLRARKLALELAGSLGWVHEARALREQLGREQVQSRRNLRAHSLELQRQAAISRRAQAAIEGPPDVAARQCVALLVRDGPEAASAALAELAARHPGALAVERARLRLDLVRGQVEIAERRLAKLDADTRDALAVERAAIQWAAGTLSPDSSDSRAQPQLAYFHGLALAAAGHHEAAAVTLERARALAPRSLALGLALALARHDLDPETPDEGPEQRFVELRAAAPALLADAAHACGVALWRDPGRELERASQYAILRRAQAMLSPTCDLESSAYHVQTPTTAPTAPTATTLRHIAAAGSGPSHLARLEARFDDLLERHEATLMWALKIEPRTRAEPRAARATGAPTPWTPRALNPEQIERFITEGYLVIPRAFDPHFARDIREAAIARIRDEPQAWVRGYDPSDARASLRGFDPADPATWTRDRIELVGPERWTIAEFAPAAWAAICDLTGGPERLATTQWGNYLLLSLRYPGQISETQPPPRSPGWHIDDPGHATRLDNIRNGLVCIALFDDLAPHSGNTWIAPESVALVTRELAARPEGVDFITERGVGITHGSQRFVEITGETGDIVLMHPLMMHSASHNPSARIRWMANPMVYLLDPLDPRRPARERSPVEQAMARALSGCTLARP